MRQNKDKKLSYHWREEVSQGHQTWYHSIC